MAGRKQHYIPQFFLRGFAQHGKGKNEQVRVVMRDRSFLVGTNGIAAEREFYSALTENTITLDETITDAENEYENIYTKLVNCEATVPLDSTEISRLICHLSVRGDHLRSSVISGFQQIVNEVIEMFSDSEECKRRIGFVDGEATGIFRESIDEAYNKNKLILQGIGMSEIKFHELCLTRFENDWDQIFQKTIPILLEHYSDFNIAKNVYDTHVKVLTKSIEPEKRVEALQKLNWRLVSYPVASIAMPDCIAIACGNDEVLYPLVYKAALDTTGVIFPLTSTKVIVGGIWNDQGYLDKLLPDIDSYVAENSWNFFLLDPKQGFDANNSQLLGKKVGEIIKSAIESSIQDSMSNSISN